MELSGPADGRGSAIDPKTIQGLATEFRALRQDVQTVAVHERTNRWTLAGAGLLIGITVTFLGAEVGRLIGPINALSGQVADSGQQVAGRIDGLQAGFGELNARLARLEALSLQARLKSFETVDLAPLPATEPGPVLVPEPAPAVSPAPVVAAPPAEPAFTVVLPEPAAAAAAPDPAPPVARPEPALSDRVELSSRPDIRVPVGAPVVSVVGVAELEAFAGIVTAAYEAGIETSLFVAGNPAWNRRVLGAVPNPIWGERYAFVPEFPSEVQNVWEIGRPDLLEFALFVQGGLAGATDVQLTVQGEGDWEQYLAAFPARTAPPAN